jgi:predicted nucleic acid-binding protein
MRTLIDTCVISEVRRLGGDAQVRQRVASLAEGDHFLSAITIGELVKGIHLLEPGRRRQELELWLAELERHYSRRLLPIDLTTARIWGEVAAKAARTGVTIPAADGLIAATGLRHGMQVMTRNTAHFAATGVRVMDPWA